MRIILILAIAALSPVLAQAAPIPADASVDHVLDALKASGDNLRDFSAHVTLTDLDQATADSSSHEGTILFQQLPDHDGRVRVEFTQLTRGDKIFAEKHQYTLSGGWLTDRDFDRKVQVRRQVARPGEKIDLLKLGQGPFPLPVGQDPQQVKKDFDVSVVAPEKGDAAQTVHLLLVPKAQTDLARKFAQIDVWVDRTSAMPVKIATLDSAQEHLQTTDLTDLRINQNLTDADFALPPVDGWDVTDEPYGQ